MKCGLIDENNLCVNVVVLGDGDYTPPEGLRCIQDKYGTAEIGLTYNETKKRFE